MKPTIQGVFKARKSVYSLLKPTALIEYPLLSHALGCRALVKHENHNPTGSFKIRGGLNLISNLSQSEKSRGVITATRGNHGQSIALACRQHGVHATVAVPEGNNPEKNEAMRAFGAELIVSGRDFDEAREKVEEVQRERGLRYIHSANELDLIHGVGTYALEILEDLPGPDYILVPLGGGSGVSGVLTVVKAVSPRTRVIGVQAENAPSIYRSWKEGRIVTTDSADTVADGLATRVPFELTFSIIQEQIDDIILASEREIESAVYDYYRTTHNVAEGAAAAALAAALKIKDRLSGKSVVLILTGGNIATELFAQILNRYSRFSEPVADES